MKKIKKKLFFTILALALTANVYAQVKVNKVIIDNLSYVQLDSVSVLYKNVSWSEDKKTITIQRVADNNEFILNVETGNLVWKAQVIGNVPNAKKIKPDTNLFPINVIETLTGTNAVIEENFVTFNYDVKLQTSNNWKLFISEELINSNIKRIGNVLLLPIDSIATKLGSNVEFMPSNIIYKRIQDGAKIDLNINTGIIKINEVIQGSVGDLFYIDTAQKLVPLNIVEIMAGVTVKLDSISSSINISLDPRIANTAFGSKLISKEIKETPFTVQSLGYDVNSDGMTSLKMSLYLGEYNGKINYQSSGNAFSGNGVKPSFLNFQWSSYSGSSGTIGDVNLGNRQLSGINVSRIKGIEYNNTTNSGDYNYSLTAGQIVQNYTKIYNQELNNIQNNTNAYTPLQYGGGAYGIRIYPKNKPYEIGFSYLNDPQLGKKWAIGSFAYKSKNSGKEPWNYYFNLDGGQLSNKINDTQSKSGIDFKGIWSASKTYSKLNLNFDGSYSGQLFEQYYQPTLQSLINNSNNVGNNPLSPLLPNTDNVGYSKLSQNANMSYRLADDLSISYGFNYNQRSNEFNTYKYQINNIGLSKTFKTGSVSVNNLVGSGTDLKGKYNVNILNLSAQKSFEYLNLLGKFDLDSVSKSKTGQINVQFMPYKTDWKNLSGSLNTSLNYNFANRDNQTNQSALMNLNYSVKNIMPIEGWNVSGGLGASVKLYEKNNAINILNIAEKSSLYSDKKINPFLFANATYSLSKAFNFQVSASYDNYGKVKMFAGISGNIDYAPARTVSNYVAQKGVLKGNVFIDDNYDGIKQPEENKPVSVLVNIKGTTLSLVTDPAGNFTIQNLSPGLYEIGVSLDNFPLGWALDEKANTRFSITGDQITQMNLPISRNYSVTGQIMSSKKGNEDLTVEIYNGDKIIKKSLTTFGGQFAFDGLKPGKYIIKAYDENEKVYTQEINLEEGKKQNYIFNMK